MPFTDLPGSDEKEGGITGRLHFRGHLVVVKRVDIEAPVGFSKGGPRDADKTKLVISFLSLVAIFRFKKKVHLLKILETFSDIN